MKTDLPDINKQIMTDLKTTLEKLENLNMVKKKVELIKDKPNVLAQTLQ